MLGKIFVIVVDIVGRDHDVYWMNETASRTYTIVTVFNMCSDPVASECGLDSGDVC